MLQFVEILYFHFIFITVIWALIQFGPKTNWDRKPDSDQRQIRTQF